MAFQGLYSIHPDPQDQPTTKEPAMAGSSGSRQGGGGKSAKRSKSPSNLSELKKAINPSKGAWKGNPRASEKVRNGIN